MNNSTNQKISPPDMNAPLDPSMPDPQSAIEVLRQTSPEFYKKRAEDPNLPLEDRTRALDAADQAEKAAAEAKALEISAKAQRYLQATEDAKRLNERLAAKGTDPSKLVTVPKPEDVGLDPQQLIDYQRQVQSEVNASGDSPTRTTADQVVKVADQKSEMQKIEEQAMLDQERSMAAQTGAMAGQARAAEKMQQAMDEKIKLVEDQQMQLDAIDPERFWKTRTTGQTIMGALGVLFGGLNTGGRNSALEVINKAIENDIGAQKTTNENKLALQQNALKRVQLQIEKFSALSQDQARKADMARVYGQLGEQRAALAQKQVQIKLRNALSSKDGIPADQVAALLSPDEQKRVVALPNGKFGIAVNESIAESSNKQLAKVNPSLQSLKELRDFAKNFNKFSLEDQARMASKLAVNFSAVKQAMDEVGALTENDIARIKDALGDPRLLPNIIAEFKVDTLVKNLESKQKGIYERAGIKLPQTQEDMLRSKLQQKGYSDAEIDEQLKQRK